MTHSELISVGWFIAVKIMNRLFVAKDEMLITHEPGMTSLPESPDIITLSKGFGLHEPSVVVECKATRADFLKDRKKPFRIYPDKGMGMFRAYVTNPGIASRIEIPFVSLFRRTFQFVIDDGHGVVPEPQDGALMLYVFVCLGTG